MKIYKNNLILLLLACSCFSGCQPVFLGPNSTGRYVELDDNPITPQKALLLAEPYLHKHYQLRLPNRSWVQDQEPVDYVFLKGNWYYIDRDNYPYKFVDENYWHSIVKVHKITGQVVEVKKRPTGYVKSGF